jgi:hypothetical protein
MNDEPKENITGGGVIEPLTPEAPEVKQTKDEESRQKFAAVYLKTGMALIVRTDFIPGHPANVLPGVDLLLGRMEATSKGYRWRERYLNNGLVCVVTIEGDMTLVRTTEIAAIRSISSRELELIRAQKAAQAAQAQAGGTVIQRPSPTLTFPGGRRRN